MSKKKPVKKASKKVSKKDCKKSCLSKCNREKAVGDAQPVVGLGNNPTSKYPRLFVYQESTWTKFKKLFGLK